MRMVGSTPAITALIQTRAIFDLMQRDFGFSIKDRLYIAPEVAMYRIGEDESIYNQAKTGKYIYQVFFDGEFVCAIADQQSKERARIEILKGLKRLLQDDKIHWNKKFYEEKEKAIKAKEAQDKAELEKKFAKAKTPEEKIVVAGIKKYLTKKSKKKYG